MEKKELLRLKEIIEKLKVVSMKRFSSYRAGYLGVDTYIARLADGTARDVDRITKGGKKGDAVVILPVTTDGKYVMVVESRPNIEDGVCISFPAGMVDNDEETEVAARRELLEETGYEANNLELLEWHYQDQGCSAAVIKTYLATYCEKIDQQHLDKNERIEPVLVTEEEMEQLVMGNDIGLGITVTDANSKIAGMNLLLKRKGE